MRCDERQPRPKLECKLDLFFKSYDNISKPLFPCLDHQGLSGIYINSRVWYHIFIILATPLDTKKICRSYVEAGTSKGKETSKPYQYCHNFWKTNSFFILTSAFSVSCYIAPWCIIVFAQRYLALVSVLPAGRVGFLLRWILKFLQNTCIHMQFVCVLHFLM